MSIACLRQRAPSGQKMATEADRAKMPSGKSLPSRGGCAEGPEGLVVEGVEGVGVGVASAGWVSWLEVVDSLQYLLGFYSIRRRASHRRVRVNTLEIKDINQ